MRLAIRVVVTPLTQHRSMARECSDNREHRWAIMTKGSRSTWRRICLRIILSTINPTRKGLISNPVLRQVLTAWTIPKRTFYLVCRKSVELIYINCLLEVLIFAIWGSEEMSKNVGGDMVGIVMVCLYCNVWGCVCVGFVLYGCVRFM